MSAISNMEDKVSITSDEKPKLVFSLGSVDNVKKLEIVRKFLLNAVC